MKVKLFRKDWEKFSNENQLLYMIGWFEFEETIYNSSNVHKIYEYLKQLNFDEIIRFLKSINGNYSLILINEEEIFICADRLRTYPILYSIVEGGGFITDDVYKYKEENNLELTLEEHNVVEQYLCSNFVIGSNTLFKNILSIQAGEVIAIARNNFGLRKNRYFLWKPNMMSSTSLLVIDEANKQDKLFQSIFQRMINSAPNVNNWIIPLSGGYDSRVIVNYLYKLGIQNVICYSYGVKDNLQSEISKQVAERLGYEWVFVNYKKWHKKIHENVDIETYTDFAFNGTSTAHLQDFIAVYALREMEVIGENDIFVPGHTLDFISGGHLKISMPNNQNIEDAFNDFKRHFSMLQFLEFKKGLKREIFNWVKESMDVDFTQLPEVINWQERQTKFIVNSVRVYEFFGFNWRIPLWDKELVEYWETIPFNERFERKLYKNVYKNHLTIPELTGVPFQNDLKQNQAKSNKKNLKDRIPKSIRRLLMSLGMSIKTSYYTDEGLSYVYNNQRQTIKDLYQHKKSIYNIRKFLLKYYRNREIRFFGINSVTTILNIAKHSK